MRRAVITGANGFLGSALVQRLMFQEGVEVWAVVRPGAKRTERIWGAHIVECALDRMHTLADMLPHGDYDAFYHFAWAGTSGKERSDYALQFENARHSCDALIAAKRIGCKKFVFAGSIMAYEQKKRVYATAKLCAQCMLKALAGRMDIAFVEAIISNVYGAGEYSQRFVVSTIKKLLKGEHVPFTSGEQMYDFLYITDAAEALSILGESGEHGQSYYVGHEEPKQLKAFLRQMADSVSPGMPLALGEIDMGTAPPLTYREFDMGKMKRLFGFEPKVDFEDGIQRVTDWLRHEIQAEGK